MENCWIDRFGCVHYCESHMDFAEYYLEKNNLTDSWYQKTHENKKIRSLYDYFEIYVREGDSPNYQVYTTSSMSYTLQGLEKTKIYGVKVRAVKGGYGGDYTRIDNTIVKTG